MAPKKRNYWLVLVNSFFVFFCNNFCNIVFNSHFTEHRLISSIPSLLSLKDLTLFPLTITIFKQRKLWFCKKRFSLFSFLIFDSILLNFLPFHSSSLTNLLLNSTDYPKSIYLNSKIEQILSSSESIILGDFNIHHWIFLFSRYSYYFSI